MGKKKYKTLKAYVDGSYNAHTGVYGSGLIMTDGINIILKKSAVGEGKSEIRNVAGEIDAAMMAVKEAERLGLEELEIYYDYAGIEYWVTGKYKSKNEYTQDYADFMKRDRPLKLHFTHVKAHSGDKFNEMADKLASGACFSGTDAKRGYPKFKGKRNDIHVKERLEQYKVNEMCINDIEWFYKLRKHAFKDYAKLRTYGKDGFSATYSMTYFEKIFTPDEVEYVKSCLEKKSDRMNAFRWAGRGLLIEDAVKKADTDMQIFSEGKEEDAETQTKGT